MTRKDRAHPHLATMANQKPARLHQPAEISGWDRGGIPPLCVCVAGTWGGTTPQLAPRLGLDDTANLRRRWQRSVRHGCLLPDKGTLLQVAQGIHLWGPRRRCGALWVVPPLWQRLPPAPDAARRE